MLAKKYYSWGGQLVESRGRVSTSTHKWVVYSSALLDEEVIPNFRHCDCAPGSGAGKRSQVNSPAEGVLLPQQFRHPRPREYVLFGLYIELAMQLQQFNRHVTLPLVYLYVT